MLITSSTWCFNIINSHYLCSPYTLMIYLKNLCVSPIIYQFSDGTPNKYLLNWNLWASRIIYFRLQKSKLGLFCHWHQWEISWVNVGRGSWCGPCQRNMKGIMEVSINGDGKVPGAAGKPWRHAVGGARVKTFTSTRHLFWEKSYVDIKRLDEKLNPWCNEAKDRWISFVVIFKGEIVLF